MKETFVVTAVNTKNLMRRDFVPMNVKRPLPDNGNERITIGNGSLRSPYRTTKRELMRALDLRSGKQLAKVRKRARFILRLRQSGQHVIVPAGPITESAKKLIDLAV